MKPAINATDVPTESRPDLPEPYASRLGDYQGRSLGDHFGLRQFGARLEVLDPGCESALRHWHSHSDEFVYVLDGELALVTDAGEQALRAGTCAGFRAGDTNAHHLVNRSQAQAQFLVVGGRDADDQVHYPDDDFQWLQDRDGNWYAARRDGTKLQAARQNSR